MAIKDSHLIATDRCEGTEPLTVLLVEHDAADARAIRREFAQATGRLFILHWVTRLDDAMKQLEKGGVDAVLLNLTLPDSQGLATLERVTRFATEAMVLILASAATEESARRAVEHGAREYFIKDHGGIDWLPRAVRYLCERKAVQDALFREQEWAQVTLNSIGDAVLTTDTEGKVTYLNLVAEAMTGWTREGARGQPLERVFAVVDEKTGLPGENPALAAIKQNKTVGLAADSILIRVDGLRSNIEDTAAPIHDRDGHVMGAVLVFHDISNSRETARRMSYLAQHDPLTDLPNRTSLNDRLGQAIGLARRHDKQIALLFIDLDNFKRINDSLGHIAGDQLLQSVARRLLTCVRSTDTVCRLGGDEFVILLSEIDDLNGAAHCAEKVHSAFDEPHRVDGHELHVDLSIGISIFPEDGDSLDVLIQNADTAMYHAKASGRDRYEFFRADMNARSLHRLNLENSLRRALAHNEFHLQFQPQMDLASGKIVGAEALLRWQDPNMGLLLPGQFISVAENCRLIIPIGRWVFIQACQQIRTWKTAGLSTVPIAINVSALEFREKNFVDDIRLALKDSGVDPSDIKLELTESVLMHDADSSVVILRKLKDLGLQLVVDDFGTGYSSLAYLKRFPIDALKIDQSFIQDVAVGRDGSINDDGTIIRAVIGMGRNLNQHVIAEGVETAEQLGFLRTHDCESGQGFLFSRPLPAGEFSRML